MADEKWREYCPLMRELCVNGHTAPMGNDADGEPVRCAFWVKLVGRNPQTGDPIDQHRCAVNWLPLLLVENALVGRQVAASVDKVASEVQNEHTTLYAALSKETQKKVLIMRQEPGSELLLDGPGTNGDKKKEE